MIQQLDEYEHIGNGYKIFNSNMNELNIRFDLLFNNVEKWNSLANSFQSISSDLFYTLTNDVPALSGKWQSVSDLVYNVEGFWSEPIEIIYKNSVNIVGSYLEIEDWLNSTFIASNFADGQIIRTDFLCRNYNSDILDGVNIDNYDINVLETLATTYNTTTLNIFQYLGFKNQIDTIISLMNTFLRKYNYKDIIIKDWTDLEQFNDFIKYNFREEKFHSLILPNVNQADLKFIHSYIHQYNVIKPKYKSYIDLKVNEIPDQILNAFLIKNVYNNISSYLFFKNINGKWTYRPYNNIDFCANNTCSDCYNLIDINQLYKNRDCLDTVKFVLTECDDSLDDVAVP